MQLRIVGKPVELPFAAKDKGPSATCVECHNGRTQPEEAANSRFPHYGSAGEMLADDGKQGKAKAIHNFRRSMWLLQQSYKDLTGNNVPKATMIQ